MTFVREQGPSLSYEVDTLGFLNAQLRDLRGLLTLAHELIQNADDAKASRMVFDATDEALVVENDSLFSDCGQVTAPDCVSATGVTCDFHRFRRVASGGKRLQDDTTGAFGIGFVSVYQVTDAPEIASGEWEWRIAPDAPPQERIRTARLSPPRTNTLITLAWAREQTNLRTRLAVEPAPQDAPDRFVEDVRVGMARAVLFLRHVRSIELRRNGARVVLLTRSASSDGDLTVEETTPKKSKITKWYVLATNFDQEATRLRSASSGRIEAKRRSQVQIAFSAQSELTAGRFYASLPTEHELPIPVFINADFFPTNDRRRILLEGDYQGQWNRSAILAAAALLGKSLLLLCEQLPMDRFWNLLDGVWQCRDSREDSLRSFWLQAQLSARAMPIVLATDGQKHKPAEMFLLQDVKEEREAIPVLADDLGLRIAVAELSRYRNLLRTIGVTELATGHIVAAMAQRNLLGPAIPLPTAPKFVNDGKKRAVLARQLSRLNRRATPDSRVASDCRIAVTTDGMLAPPAHTRIGTAFERSFFKPGPVRFLSDHNDAAVKDLCKPLSVEDGVRCLSAEDRPRLWQDWQKGQLWCVDLLGWLDRRRSELTNSRELAARLAALDVWPSSDGLHRLSDLAVPGNFTDPLKLASLVHAKLLKHQDFLVDVLGATRLNIVSYATRHVAKAFQRPDGLAPELIRTLVKVLAQHNGPLREAEHARQALAQCALVECDDGFRFPATAYIRTPLVVALLGDEYPCVAASALQLHPAVRELFVWLGVSEHPRAPHIVETIETVASGPATAEAKRRVASLLQGLGQAWSSYSSSVAMTRLRELAWLPGRGSDEWFQPSQVAASFREYLFETQATFIDVPVQVERQCADLFEFLGVQTDPTVAQVVAHLLACSDSARQVNTQVYRFLNDKVSEIPSGMLRNRRCIQVSDGSWHAPNTLFWANHGLQPYLSVLEQSWRPLSALLTALGVRDEPRPADIIQILLHVGEAQSDVPPATAWSAARICWTILNGFLESESMVPGHLSILSDIPTVPVGGGALVKPSGLLLDDRPWISRLFGDQLAGRLLPRQEGIALSLETAGVRRLSVAAEEEATDIEPVGSDEQLADRIRGRALGLGRVFSSALDRDAGDVVATLEKIRVTRTARLGVLHRIPPFEPDISGIREEPEAWLTPDDPWLYVSVDAREPWTAIARQIAIRLAPTTNISQVTPALRDVLAADSAESADRLLDDLGFTALEAAPTVATPEDSFATLKPATDPADQLVPETPDSVWKPSQPIAITKPSETNFAPKGPLAPAEPAKDMSSNSHGPTTPNVPAQSTSPGGSTVVPNKLSSPAPEAVPKLEIHARSYVTHKSSESDESQSDEPGWMDVAAAGVRHALAYEYSQGRRPHSKPHNHPGWDVESRREGNADIERFIEVKATRAVWSGYGVGLTDTEFEKARELGDHYWLYVVEQALTAPRLYAFQNPAERVSEYRIDGGWKQFSTESDASRPRSILDLPSEDLDEEAEQGE